MRLVHHLVRQHGLAHYVTNGEDVGGDLLAIGCTTHGLQHQDGVTLVLGTPTLTLQPNHRREALSMFARIGPLRAAC